MDHAESSLFVHAGKLLFYKNYYDSVQFHVTFWLQTPTARSKHQQHLSTWQMLNLLAKQKRNLALGCDSLPPSGKYLLKLDICKTYHHHIYKKLCQYSVWYPAQRIAKIHVNQSGSCSRQTELYYFDNKDASAWDAVFSRQICQKK